MGFDRSKYKTTSAAASLKLDKENKEKRPKGGGSFADNHTIDDGINRFRLFPFHIDGGGDSYRVAKCVSFLDVTKPKRDETTNRLIEGQFEVRKSPVFNAKVHGNLSADPVETYVKFAKEVAIPNFTSDEKTQKSILSLISGYRDKVSWKSGIVPVDSWVCYAAKLMSDGSWKLGTLEFKETVKKQLIDVALEISNGETPDIYTDVEEGYVIRIEKKKVDGQTKYFTELDSKLIGKTNKELQILAITELQLEEFEKLPSLHKRFVNAYKRSDFDMQLEGLERFDKALTAKGFSIEVFAIDEFLDAIAVIDSEIKDDPATEKKEDHNEVPWSTDDEKPKTQSSGTGKQNTAVVSKSSLKKAVVQKPVVDEPEEVDSQDEAPQEQPDVSQLVVKSTADRIAEMKKKYGKK